VPQSNDKMAGLSEKEKGKRFCLPEIGGKEQRTIAKELRATSRQTAPFRSAGAGQGTVLRELAAAQAGYNYAVSIIFYWQRSVRTPDQLPSSSLRIVEPAQD